MTNGNAGILTFPGLGICATCYTSHNGLMGVSVLGLVFSNRSGAYRILGNTLTVGGQGISDTSGGGTATAINAPLVLSSPQTWTVGAAGPNGYNVLTLLGGITGTRADALNIAFRGVRDADLFIDSDMEVGPVTVTGGGGLHIGTPTQSGSLNGSDGQPVTITGATLVANPRSTTGPLTLRNGVLLLGTNPQNNGATTLSVEGDATLDSSATTKTFINANGSTPGTDFSQLSATGTVALSGQLAVSQGPVSGACVPLQPGDVATLITTTGTISGTFTNAPEGATLTMVSSCQAPPPQVRIDYSANSVMATVLGGTPSGLVQPTPPQARKPGGRVLGPPRRLTVSRRHTRVPQKCQSSTSCRGRFSLTARARTGRHRRLRTVRCAAAGFRIPPTRSATTRVRVTDACLGLLRQRRHRLTVVYLSRADTGQTGQRKRVTLVLKSPTRTRRPASF